MKAESKDAGAVSDGSNDPGSSHYLKAELYELVRESPAIFEFLQHGSLDGVWYWDLQNPDHEWMSDAFWKTLGYDPLEKKPLASEWKDLIHPDDLGVAVSNFESHCADPTHPYDQVVRYKSSDGSIVWVRCRGIVIRDEEGRPIRMLGAHNDLTQLKRMEEDLRAANEKLAEIARSDALTGALNRRSFDELFPLHAAIGSRSDSTLGLLLLDIDHFKRVNDEHGHPAGDLVLRDVAGELQSQLREGDLCFRIGGEEFAIVLHGLNSGDIERIAERIRSNIGNRERVVGRVTLSSGVCTLPERAADDTRAFSGDDLARRMYRLADQALYAAKRKGRDRAEFVAFDFAAADAKSSDR